MYACTELQCIECDMSVTKATANQRGFARTGSILLYCLAILPAEFSHLRMRSFSSFLTFSWSGYSSLSLTRTKACLSNGWRSTLLLDLLLRVAQMILHVLVWNTLLRHNARRPRRVLGYKQRKKQTQEQGPPAGRTIRKVSLNVRVKKMQCNDKKIKRVSRAGGATASRVCRLVSCSCIFHLRQQSWTPMYSPETVKQKQRSMFLDIANHAFVAHKKL